MEKVIIIGLEKKIHCIDPLIRMISSNLRHVMIIDPGENPNYEELVKKFNDSIVCVLDDSQPEKLRKEIGESNKVFELKPQEIFDIEPVIDKTPRYDRFLKKWKRSNYWPKYQCKKK